MLRLLCLFSAYDLFHMSRGANSCVFGCFGPPMICSTRPAGLILVILAVLAPPTHRRARPAGLILIILAILAPPTHRRARPAGLILVFLAILAPPTHRRARPHPPCTITCLMACFSSRVSIKNRAMTHSIWIISPLTSDSLV